jgi:hypothetical protein
VTVSVYAHITGGHGEYELDFLLRNAANDTVWSWSPQSPLQHEDPLMPQQVAFHDLLLKVPSPGRYEVALLANGKEIGAAASMDWHCRGLGLNNHEDKNAWSASASASRA